MLTCSQLYKSHSSFGLGFEMPFIYDISNCRMSVSSYHAFALDDR